MKSALFVFLVASTFLPMIPVSAQTDSTFSVVRNGVEAKFPFTKLAKQEHLKALGNSVLPLYSFNSAQYNRIKGLLTNFAQLENECRLLQDNCNAKELAFSSRESVLTERANLEAERARNFEASYNTLLDVNTRLNDQLKNAEQVAKREHKRRNVRSFLTGILTLSAGVVIGITLR